MVEPMNVLWVFAHPESRSLNGLLRDEGVRALRADGHAVRESDLYAMGWNPVVDAGDFGYDSPERLDVAGESECAYRSGALSADIRAEQDKLRWADTVVVQFPLWWYGMPAILKGWFDRVFVKGFAYGVLDPETGRSRRYGDGGLTGKRALTVVTVGAHGASIGPRGVHGDLADVLFPLLHGTLFYTGMAVLAPFVVDGTNRTTAASRATALDRLRTRLAELPKAEPIPYRPEQGGDYGRDLTLVPEIEPGRSGLGIHAR